VFTGTVGHTYGFYSVAADQVGNLEALPPAAQSSTSVVAGSWVFLPFIVTHVE
jgi:hypothetical protein